MRHSAVTAVNCHLFMSGQLLCYFAAFVNDKNMSCLYDLDMRRYIISIAYVYSYVVYERPATCRRMRLTVIGLRKVEQRRLRQ